MDKLHEELKDFYVTNEKPTSKTNQEEAKQDVLDWSETGKQNKKI
jgi:hypothetical protein|tara:strand:- start:694 stop:828 length:135 start_codon:yes stop_codon:yes gene_type:complete